MYQIRIINYNIYPYDIAIEKYFTEDDFSDYYDTREKAVDFIKTLNKNGVNAYLWED